MHQGFMRRFPTTVRLPPVAPNGEGGGRSQINMQMLQLQAAGCRLQHPRLPVSIGSGSQVRFILKWCLLTALHSFCGDKRVNSAAMVSLVY